MLDFDQTLGALMDRIGTRVRISVCAADLPQPLAQVLDIEGVLTAGWDPDVVAANVGDAAIFGIEGADGFSLYLVREDFGRGQIDDAERRLHITTGGVAVVVGPPFGE